MTTFESIKIDPKILRQQLESFEIFLNEKQEITETEVSKFFKSNKHLSAFISVLHPNACSNNVALAFEFNLFGDFRCDLAVGDQEVGAYCLIEFEDAKKDSVFKKLPNKDTTEWASRFEHGFSQIVDWLWLLDDVKKNNKYEKLFKGKEINFVAYLIIGRTLFIEDEKQRFEWRRNKIEINAQKVTCLTFDDLLIALKRKIEWINTMEQKTQ